MNRLIHPLGYLVEPETGFVYSPYRPNAPIKRRITSGYIQINQKGRAVAMAHRIVWEAVFGPIPAGMVINHINGIKDDNRLDNLEMVTQGENLRHAYRAGLRRADGEHNGRHIGKMRALAAAEASP